MRKFVFCFAVCVVIGWQAASAEVIDRTTLRWMRSKPPIESIVITGNNFFSASEVKKRMYSRERTLWSALKGDRRTRIQRETYGRDTLEIKYLYLSNGFLGVRVQERFQVREKDSAALIEVTIEEGRRYYYGDITVTGSFEPRFKRRFAGITSQLKKGEPINLFAVHQARFDMKTILANEGYPYATVSFDIDTANIASLTPITFHVESDSLVRFGQITIVGAERYPEYTIWRELKVKPGEIYRRSVIIDSQRRLFESGYFSTIRLDRAGELTDRFHPDFILRVRERKPRYVTIKTGAAQSKVRDLTWNFSAGYGKRNFLGSRRYDLLAHLSFSLGRETRLLNHNYRLRFTEPWFLGVRMPLSLTARYDPGVKDPIQNYRIERWSLSLSTSKNFGLEIKTSLGAEYEEVNIFGIATDQVELRQQLEGDISVRRKLYGTFRRDSRDDIFIPRWGSLTDIAVEYFGGFLGGEDHFYKVSASWSSYQLVWPGWISATRFKLGLAQAFGESELVPVEDRFYLGGANTVRGFKENTLGPLFDNGAPRGANYIFVFNQEFRWRTLQVFRVIPLLKELLKTFPLWQSVFIDIGNGFTDYKEFKFSSLAYSYGTGLQLVSPAGPIRIDYARRIKTDRIDFDERWHFTILYAF
jgi:outer membrane protein insertion porin family